MYIGICVCVCECRFVYSMYVCMFVCVCFYIYIHCTSVLLGCIVFYCAVFGVIINDDDSPIQGQGQGHDFRAIESWKSFHFQKLDPPPFRMGAGN